MQDDRPLDRRQLDDLLEAMLPFAQQMLDKHGEFFPFGAAMLREGKVALVAGKTESAQPPSVEVIELIRAGMRSKQAEYLAIGVCYDVRVRTAADSPPTDAVCVSLEHRDGMVADVFQPYTKRGKKIEYRELYAQRGRKTVFGV
jgi:hypothetical protein